MPRHKTVPSYRLHKQSGQAIVTLPDGLGNRHDVLLGPHGTPESRAEYARVIAEWEAAARQTSRPDRATALSVNEVLLAYVRHAGEYYRHPDGTSTSELNNIRLALRPLKQLYGHTPVAAFDTLALEAVREHLIGKGLCRNRINKDVARIKRMFRWAAARKLIPANIPQALALLEGLRAGRSEALETDPVKPVPEEVVEATLPFLTLPVAAMVRLQLLTGMRPGEVAMMRGIDLDMSGKVWTYHPGSDRGPYGKHKSAWRGHRKVILIGPRGQEILRPWLRLNLQEYLFQPRDAVAAFRAQQRRRRQTRVQPSQQDRRKKKPRRQPGERYTGSAYATAVAKAVQAANRDRACAACQHREPEARCQRCQANALPHWSPNQLRHARATEIRQRFGLEAAQVILGHSRADVTQVYAERNHSLAERIATEIG